MSIHTFDAPKLSTFYINRMIQDLKQYRDALPAKEELLRLRVAAELADVAKQGFSRAVFEIFYQIDGERHNETEKPEVEVKTMKEDDHTEIVFATGQDAFFVEFGTGVTYNGAAGGSPHPWGVQNGMTIGGYGQGNGKKRVWGFYKDGQLMLTKGFKAAAPMYTACFIVASEIDRIAQGVFT